MIGHRYHQWCLTFEDTEERKVSWTNDEGKGEVEQILAGIFYRLNLADGANLGFINSESILLLRKGDAYRYVSYISLKGEGSKGMAKQMFSNGKNQMKGYKQFLDYNLELAPAKKGKDAWKAFAEYMANPEYV